MIKLKLIRKGYLKYNISKIMSCIIVMILMIIVGIISYMITIEVLKNNLSGVKLDNLGLKEQKISNLYYNVDYFKQIIYVIGFNILFIYIIYSLIISIRMKALISGMLIIYLMLCPIFTVWDIRNQMFNISMNIFNLSSSTFIVEGSFKIDKQFFKHTIITVGILILLFTVLLIYIKKKMYKRINES